LSCIEDLAPDIVRQRLVVEGFYAVNVDEAVIRRYFEAASGALQLRTYGAPSIFSPRGEGQDHNQGYDAFVPLIDSGISLYVWTGPRFLSVVLFTCKCFDTQQAVATTRDFFEMNKVAHQEF
jgi:hypothetical protein